MYNGHTYSAYYFYLQKFNFYFILYILSSPIFSGAQALPTLSQFAFDVLLYALAKGYRSVFHNNLHIALLHASL